MASKILVWLRNKASQLKMEISALYLAYKRKETPFFAKAVAITAVVYALSPIDLIPDFIPILGYLDDLIILPILIYFALKLIPKPIMEECREQAKDLWRDGKPKKWYYAIPIIAVWLLAAVLIVKAIWF
ncbi:YkvA family protein [Breznakiella homolactica]|uniref:DUF1232 domain-containing protein n=1 Tax=Breznakiella homolactica TaxID=2798577 RepID=A0A7T8B9Q6_9SPIR|nr:DUF1232 domain-containing protein [Breznakiella homolactica]QQO07443.1 DUF1232 domain-containing protein [Breznakiella homolactica]